MKRSIPATILFGFAAVLFSLSFLKSQTGCPGGICTAANTTLAAVTAAINTAADGDTVIIPAGSSDWGTATLTIDKNILIKGAGIGKTIISGGCKMIIWTTHYVDDAGPSITTPEWRLSGMTINGNGTVCDPSPTTGKALTGPPGSAQIRIKGTSQNGRIDHNKFTGPGIKGFFSNPSTYGLVDHNSDDITVTDYPLFEIGNGGVPAPMATPAGLTQGNGTFSWTERGVDHWATAKAWYFDDNVWTSNALFAVGSLEPGGAWAVIRHNSSTKGNGPHGNDTTSGGSRGVRSVESYNNYYAVNKSVNVQEWRGGSGNSFNDRFTNASRPNGTAGGQSIPYMTDSYHSAGNYGSGFYNSADGTGLFDVNDRSNVNIFTGAILPTCNVVGDGSTATNKPCVPASPSTAGTIFAAGTGATIDSSTGNITLPHSAGGGGTGFPTTFSANLLMGYVIRDTDSKPSYPAAGPRRWAIIDQHGANAATLQPHYDDATGHPNLTFTNTGNWEIRRTLHALDEPGSGKSNLITGADASNPQTVQPWAQEWDYVYQWANQRRASASDSWDTIIAGMDSTFSPGSTNWFGTDAINIPGRLAPQQWDKANFTVRGMRNGLRDIGYNDGNNPYLGSPGDHPYPGTSDGKYPKVDISGLTQAQKDAYRRIGADCDPDLPPHGCPGEPPGFQNMIINYNATSAIPGQAKVPDSTHYWGYRYPHNLADTGPAITNAPTATFSAGTSAQTFQVTTANFTGTPTIAIGAWSPSAPSNVSFGTPNCAANTFCGTASGTAAGDYTTTIMATYTPPTPDEVATQTFTLKIVSPNVAPTVSITAPSEGATFLTTDTITITANPADSDGNISSTEFYANGALIGTNAIAPFTNFAWTGMVANSYALTVKAWDNGGLPTTSDPVNITVSTPGATPTPPARIEVRP